MLINFRWYQVLYQAAVFVSRSSIRFVKINYLPIFPILQIMNVLIVLSQIYFGIHEMNFLKAVVFIFKTTKFNEKS